MPADPGAGEDAGPPAPEVFQYAVLRLVPSQERGEALNVGVVLHCRRHRFLAARTHLDAARVAALDPGLDLGLVGSHLEAVERVAAGDPAAGAVAALERSERFGWIVAPSSTILQCSPVHTGRAGDPDAALRRLVDRLVHLGGDTPDGALS